MIATDANIEGFFNNLATVQEYAVKWLRYGTELTQKEDLDRNNRMVELYKLAEILDIRPNELAKLVVVNAFLYTQANSEV